ncbi:hypothetical protein DET49_10558 [Salegentibacter sp. 24]|uniref:hypothetical protein n=1 Tax=Salegentibacter sp. 24 TaxID=2183986 RepID=UPI001061BED8|nr:hypothetical protein [Salegentibacter sp. 24]TDN90400.1 hypothetical protein DET49_10558 [Salegentibacter sp. 24]
MKYNENDSMWIRSQDKKELAKCTAFSIKRNIGGKKKSAIMGTISNGFWGRTEIILGLYDTKEVAKNELTRLQKELVTNADIYEMN